METPKSPNLPPVKQERYTADQVRRALLDAKGLVTVAARRLDCAPDTVRAYMRRYATVAAAVKEAREGIVDLGEVRLFQAVDRGEPWAIKTVLTMFGKDRGYIETTNLNHTFTATSAEQLTLEQIDAELKRRGAL